MSTGFLKITTFLFLILTMVPLCFNLVSNQSKILYPYEEPGEETGPTIPQQPFKGAPSSRHCLKDKERNESLFCVKGFFIFVENLFTHKTKYSHMINHTPYGSWN